MLIIFQVRKKMTSVQMVLKLFFLTPITFKHVEGVEILIIGAYHLFMDFHDTKGICQNFTLK